MDKKEIVFTKEEREIIGGFKGLMIFMKNNQVVDEKEADSTILQIFDEKGKIIQEIYGEV